MDDVIFWWDQRLGSVSHMILDGMCEGGGWMDGCRELDRDLVGAAGQSQVILWMCAGASMSGLDKKDVNPINLGLRDRVAV